MEGYRAVFKEGKIPKGQIVYGDMAGMSMVGAFNLTYEAMAVIQAKVKNRTMTLNEAKAAYSWMKAREQLVTRHGRGSAGYEERIAKTQKVKEQLKQYGAYVKSGRIVPRIAPGLTPAVASSTMPDSLSAVRALTAERTVTGFTQLMGTDPSILAEVVDDARPRTLRDETTRTMEEWAAADPTGLGVMLTEDLLFRDRVTHSESELKGTLMGAVGVATVVAPEVMVPLLGRMAIGGLAGKASHEAYVQLGVPSGDAAVLSAAVEIAVSGHMPVGGEVAKGIAVSRAATAVEAEGSGLLSQLRELGQYRVDPLAMGSGIPRLVKRGTVAERVAAIEGRVAVGDATLKAPYHPRTVRTDLEATYGAESLEAATVPASGAKNVRLAGQRHPVSGIVFNERGLPIFDSVLEFDTIIPAEIVSIRDRAVHMKAATQKLKEAIERGEVPRSKFSSEQLKSIMDCEERIQGCTWHHNEQVGRMQLIPEIIHTQTGHVGGFKLWYGDK
jgi:hypothetical protein